MNAKLIHAHWQLSFGYLYCSNQLVTCQSFSNLLSLLSDEHPKHKSSDHGGDRICGIPQFSKNVEKKCCNQYDDYNTLFILIV